MSGSLPDGIGLLSLDSRNLSSTSQSAEKPLPSTNHRASFQNAVLLLVNFKLCTRFIYSFMHISYQKSCGLWMVNLEPKSPIFTTPSCYLACAFVTLLGGPWSTSKNSMLTFVDPFTDRIWPSGFKCSGLAGGNENLR